jgi:hypothetical protein
MNDRNVMARGSGGPIVTASFAAIILIAVLVALFVWEPWNAAPAHAPATLQNTSATGVDRAAHE